MPTLLDNLDRESAIMLYVADELEPAERETFQRRLAAEPQLAAEVEQVRAAQGLIATELQHADARTRLPASEGVVVRRVSRAIASRLAARVPGPMQLSKRPFAMPWWSYPAAVAASLIIGFLVWSSRQEVPPMAPSEEAKREFSMMEAEQAELAEWLSTSLDATADASMDAEVEQVMSVGGGAEELNALYRSRMREENSQ
jgi:anti-sigma factor RsiW